MIEAGTVKRLARIKLVQRDVRRVQMQRAEEQVREAESTLAVRNGEVSAAREAFGSIRESSPDDLELMARAVVESSRRVVQAKEVLQAREHAFDEGRALRVEAERDVRGMDLLRARLRKLAEERAQKEEERLLETRAGRRA